VLTTKMVVRVLDAEGVLLGWAEVMAEARGDGCLWPTSADQVVVISELSGVPAALSIHWADVNIETRVPCRNTRRMALGELLPLQWPGPMMQVGPMANGLPAVTVRAPITIGVPPAQLGARDPRLAS
jgi:hypothetical protein